MAWYRAGTITVTNGSAAVTGAGTNFVANAAAGEALLGPDGRTYEVAAIVSATQLTLASNYQGATAAGQGYAILPTQSFARDLALGAAELLNTFASVRDGIGQGLIPDGTVAAPGVRFTNDQDTGMYRLAANQLALVAGGVNRLAVSPLGINVTGLVGASGAEFPYFYMTRDGIGTWSMGGSGVANDNSFNIRLGNTTMFRVNTSGFVGVGTPASPISPFHVASATGQGLEFYPGYSPGTNLTQHYNRTTPAFLANVVNAAEHIFSIGATEALRIGPSGNLLVGSTSGDGHVFSRAAGAGTALMRARSTTTSIDSLLVLASDVAGYSGAVASVYVGKIASTNRSINAGGTVNASGADYAEYMTKASGCGTIAAGDVCGVDADGFLTRTWADAVSFVVKSTDPAYVGGDTWAVGVGPRPGQDEDEGEAEFASRLAEWEADLEAERVKVDRIAFAGQVPVNLADDVDVGDYLIAAASGAGIKAVAIGAADITFEQYRRRLGRVWAIRGGRPWVDVQHG